MRGKTWVERIGGSVCRNIAERQLVGSSERGWRGRKKGIQGRRVWWLGRGRGAVSPGERGGRRGRERGSGGQARGGMPGLKRLRVVEAGELLPGDTGDVEQLSNRAIELVAMQSMVNAMLMAVATFVTSKVILLMMVVVTLMVLDHQVVISVMVAVVTLMVVVVTITREASPGQW